LVIFVLLHTFATHFFSPPLSFVRRGCCFDPIFGSIALSIVTTQTESSPGSIRTVKQVTLKKEDHTWTADFVATPELLKTPGICFVFTAYAHDGENGKTVQMPGADFYAVRLLDFFKK